MRPQLFPASLSLYLSAFASLCVSLPLIVSLYLFLSLFVSLGISVSLCLSLSVFISFPLFISLSLLASLCLSAPLFISFCIPLYLSAFLYLFDSLCLMSLFRKRVKAILFDCGFIDLDLHSIKRGFPEMALNKFAINISYITT